MSSIFTFLISTHDCKQHSQAQARAESYSYTCYLLKTTHHEDLEIVLVQIANVDVHVEKINQADLIIHHHVPEIHNQKVTYTSAEHIPEGPGIDFFNPGVVSIRIETAS
jgi:hypothetical protein